MTTRMLKHCLFACLCLPAFAAACDKSNSVGEIDTGNDDGAADGDSAESSGGPMDGGDDADDGADDGNDSGPDDPPPPGECDGLTVYEPPACETSGAPSIVDPYCYTECSGGTGCDEGFTCTTVQYNPCPCPPDAEACCGACGGEIELCMPSSFDAYCGSIIGRTFYSLEEMECGIDPEGPVLCNWRIEFDTDGDFLWMHSDVGEGSTYTCEDGMLQANVANGVEYSFDVETGILTWDGVEYQAMVT